jgi:hypothetical protein
MLPSLILTSEQIHRPFSSTPYPFTLINHVDDITSHVSLFPGPYTLPYVDTSPDPTTRARTVWQDTNRNKQATKSSHRCNNTGYCPKANYLPILLSLLAVTVFCK